MRLWDERTESLRTLGGIERRRRGWKGFLSVKCVFILIDSGFLKMKGLQLIVL